MSESCHMCLHSKRKYTVTNSTDWVCVCLKSKFDACFEDRLCEQICRYLHLYHLYLRGYKDTNGTGEIIQLFRGMILQAQNEVPAMHMQTLSCNLELDSSGALLWSISICHPNKIRWKFGVSIISYFWDCEPTRKKKSLRISPWCRWMTTINQLIWNNHHALGLIKPLVKQSAIIHFQIV